MKTVHYTKYGPPEVLQKKEIEKPSPRENEILIKIHASTVTNVDASFRRGKPLIGRFFTGLVKPKRTVPGTEFSGEIKAVGREVKGFKKGEQVLGTTDGFGSHAEYLCLPEEKITLSKKPDNLSHKVSAACDGYLTALPFLRDEGQIQQGQQILVYGASGSVGTAAVQLAKYYGADVTGVCSTANVELVRSIGADTVIDYTKEDFTDNGRKYDIVFDAVGKISFSQCKKSIKSQGKFLETTLSGHILFHMLWTSKFSSKKAIIAFTGLQPVSKRSQDLGFIKGLLERRILKPVIDRQYTLEQIVDAHRYVDSGRKKGNVIITIG